MDKKLKIKVCGMLHPDNIKAVSRLMPEYMGFIFHPGSPRYAAVGLTPPIQLPSNIRRVGVFVDATTEQIEKTATTYKLDAVQLHGREPVCLCKDLKEKGYEVIKAFPIEQQTDLSATLPYDDGSCDYLLFDAKTPKHGGSGKRFDWGILCSYGGNTPFFLSGGISPPDAEEIRALVHLGRLGHSKLAGVDLNSRFEIEPGLKDTELLERFIKNIRQ